MPTFQRYTTAGANVKNVYRNQEKCYQRFTNNVTIDRLSYVTMSPVLRHVVWLAVVFATLVAEVCGIHCWHCIGDNCDLDPTDNYRAYKRHCNPGQHCQKVYYEMFYEMKAAPSLLCQSTVRGCSTDCVPKNDFINCSHDLRTTRGCVRKDCCADADLCNAGSTLTSLTLLYAVLTILCLLLYTLAVYR